MAIPVGTVVVKAVVKTPLGRRRNTYYYAAGEGFAPPQSSNDMRRICMAFKDTFGPLYQALMSADASFEKVEARYYSAGSDNWEATSTGGPLAGSIPTSVGSEESGHDLMPDETSLILRVRTGKSGRSKRGRRFVTGLSEKVNNNGEITDTTYKDAAKDLANQVPEALEVEMYGPESGDVTLLARHYDRKNSMLEPIVSCAAIGALGTRRDRRKPLALEELP